VKPLCRPCSINRPEIRLRTPNHATHVAFFVDGLATLACSIHTEMAIRAGGFAIPLADITVEHGELPSRRLSQAMTSAIVATGARQRARTALYEPELRDPETALTIGITTPDPEIS
jgi:hypothetical protein